MATLPTPGGDVNTWGTELNEFLAVEHNADGTHDFPAGSSSFELASSTVRGATSITLNQAVPTEYANSSYKEFGYLVIDAFTPQAELRRPNVVTGSSLTFRGGGTVEGVAAALRNAHSAGAKVVFLSGSRIPASMFGATRETSIDRHPAIQQGLRECSLSRVGIGKGAILDGEGRNYNVSIPVVICPEGRAEGMTLTASGFSPIDGNNAVLTNCARDPVEVKTASVDVANNIVFTVDAHAMTVTEITTYNQKVMFHGPGLPGGIVAGRFYYLVAADEGNATNLGTDHFRLSETPAVAPGGTQTVVDITSQGTGGWCYPQVRELQKVYLRDVRVEGNLLTEARSGVVATAATDLLTLTGHHLQNNQPVRFTTTGTLPAPLSTGVTFFVRDRTETTFKVSGVEQGPAVDLTDTGSGTHSVVTLINGFTAELQQQTNIDNLRTDNCPGFGYCLSGQEAVHLNFEAIGCGVSVRFENTLADYFYGWNCELYDRKGIYMPATAAYLYPYEPAGHKVFSMLFSGTHDEPNSNAAVAAEQYTVTADNTTDVFTVAAGHKFYNGTLVMFNCEPAGIPTGLVRGKVYRVRDRTATTFKLSTLDSLGDTVNITSNGSGTITVYQARPIVDIACDNTQNITIQNVMWTMPPGTLGLLSRASGGVPRNEAPSYNIQSATMYGSSGLTDNGGIMAINDDDHEVWLDAQLDLGRTLGAIYGERNENSNLRDPATVIVVRGTGGYVKLGGQGPNNPSMVTMGGAQQTGAQQLWRNRDTGTDWSGVSKLGYLFTQATAAPIDADIANSQVFWWFDDTAGTPLVKFKGKDSAGAVFTKSL